MDFNGKTSRAIPTTPRTADTTTPCQDMKISVKVRAEQAIQKIGNARFMAKCPRNALDSTRDFVEALCLFRTGMRLPAEWSLTHK